MIAPSSFMHRPGKVKVSIPRRLLLITVIPVLGLLALGGVSFQTYFLEHRSFVEDIRSLAAYRLEVDEFAAFSEILAAERNAALHLSVRREDSLRLKAYQARIAATDQAIAVLMAKLDRLAGSPQAAFFAEKSDSIRRFFATQVPDARAGAIQGIHASGEVFTIYMKIMYSALGISESYRRTVHTPDGLNIYDAIQATQKIQQQELCAASLMAHGLANGGLQRDELAILRRQFLVSTEGEYFMLKFQPEIRANFRTVMRGTDDDTAFYQYLTDLASIQPERIPLLVFKPATMTLTELVRQHFETYAKAYEYSFAFGEQKLAAVAGERARRAYLVGAFLFAGIVASLGLNLAITRSTRRDLVHVSANIALASDDVKSASTQLTSAGEHMSRDAGNYASAIEKISTSLNHVSAVAETNKNHAAAATATTTNARKSVDQGFDTIQQLDAAMNSARNSGQKINQVIERINELSFQTNLLALNAAVEAGRAGAAGAGFAVVADEVRQLAGRCAEAARETAELIGESAKDTATAIAKSDELAGRFKNVSHNIHEVNEIVTQISGNFIQQASSITEISHSVSKQREIAQSMATAAKKAATTVFSMENQVKSLWTSVDRMDQLLGKTAAPSAAKRSPKNSCASGEPAAQPAEPAVTAGSKGPPKNKMRANRALLKV